MRKINYKQLAISSGATVLLIIACIDLLTTISTWFYQNLIIGRTATFTVFGMFIATIEIMYIGWFTIYFDTVTNKKIDCANNQSK